MNRSRIQPLQGANALILLCYAVPFVAMVVSILLGTGGTLIFSLDDPYIHMAVAENIARGGYGVNLQEYSSPSSSILFPYLLTPLAWLNIEVTWPLLLANAALALGSVSILYRIYASFYGWTSGLWSRVGHVVLFILCINAVGLPFTGMEHNIHVFFTLLLLWLWMQYLEKGTLNALFYLSIVMIVLIRFEGFAFAGASLLLLVFEKKYRQFFISLLLIAVTLGLYGWFMKSHDLPFLPSSVQIKSGITSSADSGNYGGALINMLKNLGENMINIKGGGFLMTAFVVYCAYRFFAGVKEKPMSNATKMAFLAGASIFGHLLFGRFGWFFRYEVYAVALMLGSLMYLLKDRPFPEKWALYPPLVFMALFYSFAIPRMPKLAVSIYDQQYQMGRFATRYFPENVAVNDLGLVSYRNDHFVLDFWGLGSEDVRKLRIAMKFDHPDTIKALSNRKQIAYAMIYDDWFGQGMPKDWKKVAVMKTEYAPALRDVVTFYLADTTKMDRFRSSLESFGKTLPKHSTLTLLR